MSMVLIVPAGRDETEDRGRFRPLLDLDHHIDGTMVA
jgi:hypothetical protein